MQLRADSLRITFVDAAGARFTALDIPRLEAGCGDSLAITGPSGSGKSTLLYALAGLVDDLEGNVAWDETMLMRLPQTARDRWRRENAGFVFQDFHLIAELSPIENVLMPARFALFSASADLKARALNLLDELRVPIARKLSSQLSRGEQQRVAIARALLFDPPIILADEPTASLDAEAANDVSTLLTELAARSGKLVITVSHDERLIERCGARLALEHGRLKQHDVAAVL
ncbi:MAG: ATP-binding cassette domain-containing protein [Beijerinckiaceae bacterium]|nr:ATP-binding cassette domain-containing protein [Beijerinckiaceae bacterium]